MLAGFFAVAVALVDPGREFLAQDDAWAYARMVQHLLRSGEYRLDAWSAANNPVQIGLAGLLAQLFGYSLSLLRLTTLGLLAAGLAAFFALLREIGLQPRASATFTLALFASPFVFMLGFAFMSDVQFMSWTIISTWLYMRGLRRGSAGLVVLASLAAAAAIGTRQFGIAIVVGWLIAGFRHRDRVPARLWMPALAAPLLASAWQLQAGLSAPNFTQAYRLQEQADFLALPAKTLLREAAWRGVTLLQYLGIALLPLAPVLAALQWRRSAALGLRAAFARPRRLRRCPELVGHAWPLALTLLVGFASVQLIRGSSVVTARDPGARILALPWMLPNAFHPHPTLMRALAMCGCLVGLAFLHVLLKGAWRSRDDAADRGLAADFTIAAGLSLVAVHLVYVQLMDTYLIDMLPFAVLACALALKHAPPGNGWAVASSAAASVALAAALALWMRGDYNRQEAQWLAGDRLLAAGVGRTCVGGTRHWMEYQGAFDDWLEATNPDPRRVAASVPGRRRTPLDGPFYDWLNRRSWYATHQVSSDPTPPAGWTLAEVVPYRNALFEERTFRVFRRVAPRPPDAEPCRP